MAVRRISAVTLAVRDMARSVEFYQSTVGLTLLYGGPGANFTSFSIGDGYLNLISRRRPGNVLVGSVNHLRGRRR